MDFKKSTVLQPCPHGLHDIQNEGRQRLWDVHYRKLLESWSILSCDTHLTFLLATLVLPPSPPPPPPKIKKKTEQKQQQQQNKTKQFKRRQKKSNYEQTYPIFALKLYEGHVYIPIKLKNIHVLQNWNR